MAFEISHKIHSLCSFVVIFLALSLTALAQQSKLSDVRIDVDLTHQTTGLRPTDGYLTDWYVVGPFSATAKEITSTVSRAKDPDTDLTVGETTHTWIGTKLKESTIHLVLSDLLGEGAKGVAFLQSEVYVNRDTLVRIKVRADEEVACWINGEAIVLTQVKSTSKEKTLEGNARLRLGFSNVLLATRNESAPWRVSAQLLHKDGSLIEAQRLWILEDAGFIE